MEASIDIAKTLLKPVGKIIVVLPNIFTVMLSTGNPFTKEWLLKYNVYKTLSTLETLGYSKHKDFKEYDLFII